MAPPYDGEPAGFCLQQLLPIPKRDLNGYLSEPSSPCLGRSGPARPEDALSNDDDIRHLSSLAKLPLPQPESPKRRRFGTDSVRELRKTSSCSTPSHITGMTPTSLSMASPAWSFQGEPDLPDWWTRESLEKDEEKHSSIAVALEALQQYFQEYSGKADAVDPFWKRKSGKSVLSVVICRRNDGVPGFVAHRGMNTEVCLAAGSLCAERSAISRAATDFHSAADIVTIATMDPEDKMNPLWPCEVCQSWLSKLRPQSPEISVIAVGSLSFQSFAVRVNGENQLAPRPFLLPSLRMKLQDSLVNWSDLVVLAEGTVEMPWESRELIYIDGAWTFLHSAHQKILREARARGSHLLVGVHSDDVLSHEFDCPVLEPFEQRVGRILENRHVSSVLKDAPWCLTADMLNCLGIKKVICGSISKSRDGGKEDADNDPYRVARDLGILETVLSLDETTEQSVHNEIIMSPVRRPAQSPCLGSAQALLESEGFML